MISHDWPAGIERCGNLDQLLRIKPFFKNDASRSKGEWMELFINNIDIGGSPSFGKPCAHKVAQEA